MSTAPSPAAPAGELILPILAKYWWLILLRGIAAIVFGMLAFIWPGITLLTLVLFYGAFALVDGVLALAHAIMGGNVGSRWWLALVGVAGIAAGLVTFMMPGVTALVLLIFIAVLGDRARRVPDHRRDPPAQGDRQRVADRAVRRALGAVRHHAAGRAGRRRILGLIWVIGSYCDRVRHHAGDGGLQAEEARRVAFRRAAVASKNLRGRDHMPGLTVSHEIRTVRLGAGASAAARTSTRRRGSATSSSTTSRPRRSATTPPSWSSIISPASARCRRASTCSPGWRRAPRPCGSAPRCWCCRGTIRCCSPSRPRPSTCSRTGGSNSASARAIGTTSSPASAFRSRRPTSASRNRSSVILKAWTSERALLAPRQVLEFREHRGRAADEAEAASADLDGGGPAGLDPQGGAARRQAAARPVRLDRR